MQRKTNNILVKNVLLRRCKMKLHLNCAGPIVSLLLLLLIYLMLVTIGLGSKIGTKVANKNQQ